MPPVLVEKQGRVLVMTLNRPEALNAIDTSVTAALLDALTRLDEEDDLTVAVLTGAGQVFCAGMDLKAFATAGPPKRFDELMEWNGNKPVIAAVEGSAMGGGLELALICDLIVAADSVKFATPEVRLGLFAAGGGLLRLPRRLPYSVAMEMALTGRPITAGEARQMGLVNRLAPTGEALTAAVALAEEIAEQAPLAVSASKRLIRDGIDLSEGEFWERQKPHIRTVFRSEDAREGARSFAEKRRPSWTGR